MRHCIIKVLNAIVFLIKTHVECQYNNFNVLYHEFHFDCFKIPDSPAVKIYEKNDT